MDRLWSAFVGEFFPPATRFHMSDIPDMSGKVVLVTGANTGIGKETARVRVPSARHLLRTDACIFIFSGPPHKERESLYCLP